MIKAKNILLIDDDEITNYINSDLIKSLDIAEKVTVASSGAEAISYLEKCTEHATDEYTYPDFIFLDINMPEMDGFEFLENYIKIFNGFHKMPVFTMLTTSFIKDEVAKALDMNQIIKGYVEKPLTPEIVLEIYNNYLKNVSNK
jgi:CheY-like chemotaxis protein